MSVSFTSSPPAIVRVSSLDIDDPWAAAASSSSSSSSSPSEGLIGRSLGLCSATSAAWLPFSALPASAC